MSLVFLDIIYRTPQIFDEKFALNRIFPATKHFTDRLFIIIKKQI